jgi:Helix-turn-helix domain
MSNRPNISREELRRPFADGNGAPNGVILSPQDLANLLGRSVKTIYAWMAAGRLDGCYRKRGKHCLIWRDRALDRIFNGPEW